MAESRFTVSRELAAALEHLHRVEELAREFQREEVDRPDRDEPDAWRCRLCDARVPLCGPYPITVHNERCWWRRFRELFDQWEARE